MIVGLHIVVETYGKRFCDICLLLVVVVKGPGKLRLVARCKNDRLESRPTQNLAASVVHSHKGFINIKHENTCGAYRKADIVSKIAPLRMRCSLRKTFKQIKSWLLAQIVWIPHQILTNAPIDNIECLHQRVLDDD